MELTKSNVDFIKSEVQKEGIKFSHLQDDFIDHICTQVENEMALGSSFEDSLIKVKRNLDFRSLKSIEVNTLVLLNKYLLRTRKKANALGLGSLIIVLAGMLMMLRHIEIGNYLFLFGMAALAFGYIPTLFIYSIKKSPAKNRKAVNLTGMAAALVTTASFVFVGMGWPFKSYVVMFAFLSLFIFLLVYLIDTLKSKESRVLNLSIIFFMFIFLSFEMIGFHLSNASEQRELYAIQTGLVESINYQHQKNKRMMSATVLQDSTNHEFDLLEFKTRELVDIINEVKALFTDNNSEKLTNSLLKYDIPHFAAEHHAKLEAAVLEYQHYALSVVEDFVDSKLTSHIKNNIQWSGLFFYNPTLITYNNLLNLEYQVLEVQGEILSTFLLLHLPC